MRPIEDLSFWPGFEIAACHQSDTNTLTFELQPQLSVALCGRCRQPSPLVHDTYIRQIRDRDLLDQRVLLRLPVRRVDCLQCGCCSEHIEWLRPASRLTRRLETWAEALLQLMPISHVSQLTWLHWHTLKTLEKRCLQA